ncbi:hypothetical protein [Psychrobacillus sp. NPDC096389]|uniref:hypothetical protein n=1 Tax=Psychrobacillus sp. NPDC096389 TaxID=3364490 RepID=UPI0037FF0BE0
MYILSDEPDMTGLFINQNTRVRVHKITEDGIEVIIRSNEDKLGFIPYCNLTTNKEQLFKEKKLYVRYLGYNERYLLLTEEDA